MKKRVIALFLTAMMGMSMAACGTQETIQEPNRVSVSGILPETGDVIVTTTYIGTVEPKESIAVYPMVDADIIQMNAALGKEVKKGDALFTLDNSEANEAVAEAQEEYDVLKKAAEQAKTDAEKAEKDAETAKKEVATTNLTLVKTNLSSAQDKLSVAKTEIDDIQKQLGKMKDATDKSISMTGDERRELQQVIESANEEVGKAKTDLTTLETNLSKIQIDATKFETVKTNLSKAQDELKYAESYLNTAKGSLATTMDKKQVEDLEDDIADAETKIKNTGDFLTTVKNNLPTTATTSSTTTSNSSATTTTTSNSSTTTTTSGTSLSTTVETAYDQQLLLAEKKLNEAKQLLELYQVTSPIDGVVETIYIEQNEKAFMDEPCLVISNKSNIEVTFQVPETATLTLHVGDKVKVEKNGAMNEASITEVGMMADEQTKLFTVKASLGAVTGFATGTSVKVYADTQKATQTMIIPYDSLYFQEGNAYVYCVVEDEALRRPVQVGLMNDQYAQILDGLTTQDIVISTWSSQLKDGAEVDLLFVIGNSSTVDMPEDTTEETPEQITDDSEPINPDDNVEEEQKWVLPDLD